MYLHHMLMVSESRREHRFPENTVTAAGELVLAYLEEQRVLLTIRLTISPSPNDPF